MRKKSLKFVVANVLMVAALFFAQTSAYACTVWIVEQPKIPNKLLVKD